MAKDVKEGRWAHSARDRSQQLLANVAAKLRTNHLWQRMLKNTICTTTGLIIGVIPAVVHVFGVSTYLGAIVTIFAHPGQRFGQVTEALALVVAGTFLAIGWCILGVYLSSLVIEHNLSAAYGIRALFFALALIFHGYLRSSTPRLFIMVFFLLLNGISLLTTTSKLVTVSMVTSYAFPTLVGVGLVLLANLLIFPETSSGFLGTSTIETLSETIKCLEDSGDWFLSDPTADIKAATDDKTVISIRTKLASLTDRKAKLRGKLASTKKAQSECSFELVLAVLPPRSLKLISVDAMSRLVRNTISLINACESKFALTGNGNDGEENQEKVDKDEEDLNGTDSDSSSDSSADVPEASKKTRRKSRHLRNLELVKPIREIESGDLKLLEQILSQVRAPAMALQEQIHQALHVICCSIAFSYDVAHLPSGSPAPKGIAFEEIDIRLSTFADALRSFDHNSAQALAQAAATVNEGDTDEQAVDILPRTEIFLISSFLISLRQAASQISDMLQYSRTLVERRNARGGKKVLHFPKIGWKKWLRSGGEIDMNALPKDARRDARTGRGIDEEDPHDARVDEEFSMKGERLVRHPTDEESGLGNGKLPDPPQQKSTSLGKGPQESVASTIMWLRGLLADVVDFVLESDDLAYALKMTVAAFIVSWPAFVPAFNGWYNEVRGSWASLQLVLLFEVSVGTSFMGFFLRAMGVVSGCVVGFLAYEIGRGNLIVAVVVMAIAIVPSSYVHLGTGWVKTGIISQVSLAVVGLATLLQDDTEPWDVFVKRLSCFLTGGAVALFIELTLFPVRARDCLVESVASSITHISSMEASVAVGIETAANLHANSLSFASFNQAKAKAEGALSAARTFLPFTLTEPRIKGSFRDQATIYEEIVYVLYQIIERMDSLVHGRKAFGSAVLEQYNAEVLYYRRNVAASIALTLFAVQEALTTRLPLPQFLPSCRVAQLRYISRVRELMLEQLDLLPERGRRVSVDPRRGSAVFLEPAAVEALTKQTFLAWNSGSAGMMEIIEYLEELVDLAKLLVGVNDFRTGMLQRPKFHEYVRRIKEREMASTSAAESEHTAQAQQRSQSSNSGKVHKRRGFSFARKSPARTTATVRGAGADGADDVGDDPTVDDLPLSLQHVRTKRRDERDFERLRRLSTVDDKGKGALRQVKTWRG